MYITNVCVYIYIYTHIINVSVKKQHSSGETYPLGHELEKHQTRGLRGASAIVLPGRGFSDFFQ